MDERKLELTREDSIRFTWSFKIEGRRIDLNYEALEYDGCDEFSHFVWARDLKHNYRKYLCISRKRKIWLDEYKVDPETAKRQRRYYWEDAPMPEWLNKLIQREKAMV